MRVALHATGEVGTRAGRILLAEPDLTALGLYGQTGRTEDRRTMAIDSLAGFDVFVSDDPSPGSPAMLAAESGLHCVTANRPRGRSLGRRFAAAGTTLLAPADLAMGIAATLAAHESARATTASSVVVAWTTEGRPLRRGTAVPFPDPVGPRWAHKRRRTRRGGAVTRLIAPAPPPWAGALARITEGGSELILGVADHGSHLAAIALAAGALAVVGDHYPPGVAEPADAASAYLAAAVRIGLGVAGYSGSG